MSTESPKPRNPRTVRVRQLILDAAVELLLANGASEVTASRVAEETGVARTTIYRQWPDQASLLLATVETLVKPHRTITSTGDLETDLVEALSNLRTRLTKRRVRPVFAALVDHSHRDDAFVAAQRRFADGLTQPIVDVLDEARNRGALPADIDPAVAATTLAGPLIYQFLVTLNDVDDDLITEVTSRFLRANRLV